MAYISGISYPTIVADRDRLNELAWGLSHDDDTRALDLVNRTSPTEGQINDMMKRVARLRAIVEEKRSESNTGKKIDATRGVINEMNSYIRLGMASVKQKQDSKISDK